MANWRQIPNGSVEIQTGLWAYLHSFTVSGITRSYYKLYASEGYCFYNIEIGENYDEEGNLLPLEERMYATYTSTAYTTIEELNAVYVSVPYEDGYEVVSISKPTEKI